jgi:hypothetical protein
MVIGSRCSIAAALATACEPFPWCEKQRRVGPGTGPHHTDSSRGDLPQAGSNICEIALVETKILPGRQRQGGVIAALGNAQVFLGLREIWVQT